MKNALSHTGFAMLLLAAPVPAAGPLRPHPDNPRWFTDGSGKAIYLAGSHIWHSFQDHGHRRESGEDPPPVFDYDRFLSVLEANGHNFTRLWRWELPRWTDDTPKKTVEYTRPHPWQRTGPGKAKDGKPKFDLTRFDDEYFERLRSRAKKAGDRGVYVALMLFELWGVQHVPDAWAYHPFAGPNNVNGVEADENGDGHGIEVHTLRDTAVGKRVREIHEAYVRKVIDTVHDLDNVLYEIGNEGGTYSTEWQYHLIEFIKKYQANKPKQHPVGMSFQWSRRKEHRGSNALLFKSPADWISPNEGGAGENYGRDPTPEYKGKIIVADTDHLGWNAKRDHDWFWKQFCRGNHTLYLEWAYASPTEATAARQGIGQTVRYSRKVDLARMNPSWEIASTKYCLANPGSEYLVYQPGKGPFTVDLKSVSGTVAVEWFNPTTGKTAAGEPVAGGRVREFTPPAGGPAVLHVKAKAAR